MTKRKTFISYFNLVLVAIKCTKSVTSSCTIDKCTLPKFGGSNFGFKLTPQTFEVSGRCYCWSDMKEFLKWPDGAELCKKFNARFPLPQSKAEMTAFSKVFDPISGYAWVDMINRKISGNVL